MEDDFVLRKPPTSINRNSFQQAACNRFNINQLETTNFNRFQQGLESGSGPGALPHASHGTPLNPTSKNFPMLKTIETRGFDSYRFDYSFR
jgi:hypothetical protein